MPQLYESHTAPHTYSVHLRYSRPSCLPKTQIICQIGSSFSDAFAAFTKAFRGKTRLHWDERFEPGYLQQRLYKEGDGGTWGGLDGGGVGPSSAVGGLKTGLCVGGNNAAIKTEKGASAGGLDTEQDAEALDIRLVPFKYTPPQEGKPRGLMPGVAMHKEKIWKWTNDGCTI
jgi:hypothetical protein